MIRWPARHRAFLRKQYSAGSSNKVLAIPLSRIRENFDHGRLEDVFVVASVAVVCHLKQRERC